jgi:hypothetical protein
MAMTCFYLQELASNELSEKVSRVKADFKATLNHQLTQGFMKPWTDWAHAKGKKVETKLMVLPPIFWTYTHKQTYPNVRLLARPIFP